jgi:methylated-DNA-[protein]-cysteine S-methyltransferase
MNTSEKNIVFTDYLSTPLGILQIQANTVGLSAIRFVDKESSSKANMHTQNAMQQLNEYFCGTRHEFDLPISVQGTQFQQQVWQQLKAIPYGKTYSYQDIAKQINNPKAVRAVGSANGKNPLTIVVPCHRVIGANGSLTGYAWGVSRKQYLLQHEMTHGKFQLS